MGRISSGMRLDYMLQILENIKSSKKLAEILGTPVERYIAIVVIDGHVRFHTLAPFEDPTKNFSEDQIRFASEELNRIVEAHKPGKTDLPGIL